MSHDVVVAGAWGAEWHDPATLESSFDYPPGRGSYEISLRCLMSAGTPNLPAAGRCADGDRMAGASLRVMGTAMVTGQAAGVAAGVAAALGPSATPGELRRQGAWLAAP